MCARVTSPDRLKKRAEEERFLRAFKLLLYSVILGLSAALPFLRSVEAYEAWHAPVRVAAWHPPIVLAWWLVPLVLWLMMIQATLQQKLLSQSFYGAVLGLAIFGGSAAGASLGRPQALPNHPDTLLLDQALGLQLSLERHFVKEGNYPDRSRFKARVLPEFHPTVRPRIVYDSGRCEAVGDLLLVLEAKQYSIRVCGLGGQPGGSPRHLRADGKIYKLGPNTGLQKAIFFKAMQKEGDEPLRDGPRRPSSR